MPQQLLPDLSISADSMPAPVTGLGVEAAVGNQTDDDLPTDKDREQGAKPSRQDERGGRLGA
jgi:hypothetical protein